MGINLSIRLTFHLLSEMDSPIYLYWIKNFQIRPKAKFYHANTFN